MSVQGVSGIAVASTAAGGILIWSGIKGASITDSLRSLITGSPPSGTNVNPIGTPVSSQPAATGTVGLGGNAAGGTLVSFAEAYQGHLYSYGGYESNPAGWDCSSYMNWVVGHDAGLAIPGYAAGAYKGTVHGPPTGSWLLWTGCQTITKASLMPGDLLVWQTHMGMYVGNGNMISALGPTGTHSTTITSIAGGSPGAELLFCKRLRAVVAAPTASTVSLAAATARDTSALIGG
jgi:cell wall-associated NlpC family hydrolase